MAFMIAGKKLLLFLRFSIIVFILFLQFTCLIFGKQKYAYPDNSLFWFEEIYYNENNAFGVVEDIQQDAFGFIWVGTQDGLYRYDGIRFKPYYFRRNDTNSLSNNIVQDLFLDSEDHLWIATSNGLNRYNEVRDNFTRIFLGVNGDTRNYNDIYKIDEDLKGNLWFATLGGGAFFREGKTGKFLPFTDINASQKIDFSRNIRTVFCDNAGIIWFGTSDKGVFYYHPQNREMIKLPLGNPDGDHLFGSDIRSIVEGPDGLIWIGTNGNGITRYNKKLNYYTYLLSDPANPETLGNSVIWNQYLDSRNSLWVCTEGGGLNLYHLKTNTFTRFQLSYDKEGYISSNIVRVIHEDIAGNLWIGNFNAPINYLDMHRKPFALMQNELTGESKAGSNQVTAVLIDSDCALWVGTDGGGIWKYPEVSGEPSIFLHNAAIKSSAPNDKPLCFEEDLDGNIWIGFYLGGLSCYRKKENRFINFYPDGTSNNPRGIQVWDLLLEGDSLWIATEKGLEVLSISRGTFHTFPIEETGRGTNSALLWKLFLDSKNRLLIGTSHGLNVFNKYNHTFSYYKFEVDNQNSLSENWVLSINEDSKGRIWIGTNGGGLNLWKDPENRFECFSTEYGLPGNVINAILEDHDHNLWISTNNGLARFNYDSLKVATYNANDGLQNNRYNKNAAYQDTDGTMYFGGINGLNYFNPSEIHENLFKPPVLITNFEILHRPCNIHDPKSPVHKNYHLVDEIHLREEHLVFTIEFAALNYTHPEENRYRYILEGFDEDWSDAETSNSVTYTNLPAGKYRFRVIGSNNDKLWNEAGSSFLLIVHPPFYRSWWFIVIISLVFLYLLFLIYQSRVTNVRVMNTKLSELVAERTKELEERNYEIAKQNKEILSQRDYATTQRDKIKKQNEELENHRNSLQQLVEERTRELMVAKEKAEESDKLKTAFLENISHEIRTPLNAILGFLNLLSDKIDDHESRNYYLRIIDESGRNMLRLIEDIIDFARMQTGELKPVLSECHVSNVVRELILWMRERVSREKQNINVINKFPHEDVIMFTDEKKLRQIFSKLLDNSFQNTERGYISLGIHNQDEDRITFFVEDSGVGIDKENLDKIFDRFFTVQEDSVPKGMRGSGLGLAFARTMTEIMGGEIWVESQKSRGSTFYFSLPYLPVTIQKKASSDLSSGKKKYFWPDRTVLVAEDEESNYLLIEAMLRETKVRIIHVKDGVELLEKVDEGSQFDLVLLDLKMPRMGGLNAMKIIREHHGEIPLIIQTAYDHTNHRQKSFDLGCDDFLIKPLKKKELLEVMKKYLG